MLFILSMACMTAGSVAWVVGTRIKVGVFHVPPPTPPSYEETRQWRLEKKRFEKRFEKAIRIRLILVRVEDCLFKAGVALFFVGVITTLL